MASLVERVSALALFSLLVAGCSSGSGDGAATGATCESVCAKAASFSCPSAPSEPECVSECKSELTGVACSTEGLELAACVYDRGTVQCGASDYVVEEDFTVLCPNEAVALTACYVCQPASDDTPCLACTKSSCCAELRAVTEEPAFLDWNACRDACFDSSCDDACDEQFPGVRARLGAAAGCGLAQCPACMG